MKEKLEFEGQEQQSTSERPAKKLRLAKETLKTLESGDMGNYVVVESNCPGCLTYSRNYSCRPTVCD